jgi:solute carrier family 39 (zinc transporter), member 13
MRGYLNLLANFIDNLSHGAAIGASFSIGPLLGLTTLVAILLHQMAHEMGDFAVLLQSGFDRRQATQAQLITGTGGLVGAGFALFYSSRCQS